MTDTSADVTTGDGYSVSSLDRLGSGPGFRKVRTPMGVTAFGVNGIVIPPGISGMKHYHENQEELYFVHSGVIEMRFEDGTTHRLEPGSIAWVDATTVRTLTNPGDVDAVYLCVGGKGGYVPRDGVVVE